MLQGTGGLRGIHVILLSAMMVCVNLPKNRETKLYTVKHAQQTAL